MGGGDVKFSGLWGVSKVWFWNFLWGEANPLEAVTIVYRMVTRIRSYDAYFSFLIIGATFGGRLGMATMRASNELGRPDLTKKLAHSMDFLGQPLFRNHVFEIFRGGPSLPLMQQSL